MQYKGTYSYTDIATGGAAGGSGKNRDNKNTQGVYLCAHCHKMEKKKKNVAPYSQRNLEAL